MPWMKVDGAAALELDDDARKRRIPSRETLFVRDDMHLARDCGYGRVEDLLEDLLPVGNDCYARQIQESFEFVAS